jgi:hypothetical protein
METAYQSTEFDVVQAGQQSKKNCFNSRRWPFKRMDNPSTPNRDVYLAKRISKGKNLIHV